MSATGRARPVRAMLLDSLGTLLRLEPPAPALVRELRARFGLELSIAQAQRAMASEIAYYRAHHLEGRDRATLTELRRRCAAVLRAELPEAAGGGVEEDELLPALLAALRFRPYPEVAEALEGLRARGLRLVVVSNWDCSLHDVLEETGIAMRVHGAVTSAEVGSAKPSPGIFARALSLAGVPASESLHAGDSLVEDVEGARAAGIEPVLVRRGTAAAPASPSGPACIGSLHGLAALAT